MKAVTALYSTAYFLKTRLHCILLKNTKVQTEKSQEEEEVEVKKISILFATPIPILNKNTFTNFTYSSFSREYHVYKDVRIPNKNGVAIIWDDCVSKKIAGHFALNWSKVAS